MSRTVALSTLRSDVQFKADVGGATVRHTPAQINRLINQSIQMFRERISDEGSTHYLVPYSGTLGVGPTSPFAFYQLDLSSGPSPALVRTYGIDVTIDGTVCKLEHVPFESRNDYGTIAGGSRPVAWAHFRTDQVAILPAPSAAYPFTVWYLPKFTDLSADGDTFDGVAGWEEWVVWDVVCQIIARDQFPQAFAIAEQRRAEVEQRVIRGATKVSQAGGAHVGRDSFGRKLPSFLGGSRRPQAVAGGPYVPANGSVTDAMLADMTGPTVKGVLSGTTRPYSIGIGTLTTYLAQFSTLQRGLVPAPLSIGSRYLDDSGNWSIPAGGGGGGSVGPSGAIQYQAGTGMAGASGFRIHGATPSLVVSLDGTMRVTGGEVAVGSGTVRVTPSGVDVGGGSVVNVATLVTSALSAPNFTDTVAGLAPLSGGGTANFLRADGSWATPPAGSASAAGDTDYVQYRDALGGLQGASGVRIVASGTALLLGASGPNTGLVRLGQSFQFVALNQSGVSVNLIQNASNGGSGAYVFGSSSVRANIQRAEGLFRWELNGASGTSLSLTETGLAMSQHSLSVGSLNVGSGIANSQLALMQTGTVKANLTGTGTPSDVSIATLHAFAPTFTSTNPGTVPESGGGSANFLRADGTWAVPPGTGGSSSPGGDAANVQFRTAAGTFGGASGVQVVASGMAIQFGLPAGAGQGHIRGGQSMSVYGLDAAGADFRMIGMNGSGTLELGRSGVAARVFGEFTAQNLTLASGLSDSNLQPMGSGTVKGRLIGTGTPSDISIPTLHAFAPTFTSTRPGTVPQSGGGTSNYLRADGSWAAPSGAAQYPPVGGVTNLEMAVMPTGTVKGNLAGNATPSDVSIATLFAFAPTFTSTQRGIVPESGGGTSNYLRADGGWAAPSGAAQFPPSGGVQNYQMAPVASGIVKANLGPSGPLTDVSIATLFAFSPTFTATKPGTVPESGGGTTNFLRADGTWTTPAGAPATPGGGPNSIQFNDNGVTNGASGYGFSSAGGALGIGVPSFLPGAGDIRVASGLNITANLPSGIAGVAARQNLFDWSGGGASGVLKVGGASGIMGTVRSEVATGGAFDWLIGGQTGMSLKPTGLDAAQFHIKAKSIDVGHINGLPFDFNGLKRGLDIGNSSGLPSGLSLYLPRGAGSGANRYLIPSGVNGTGTQAAPRFVTLSPTGGRGGGVIRIERVHDGGWPFEVRTPTGSTLHSFPSGAKGWADFMFEKPSGAVFQLAGHADMY